MLRREQVEIGKEFVEHSGTVISHQIFDYRNYHSIALFIIVHQYRRFRLNLDA